jgi:hypothetical protein
MKTLRFALAISALVAGVLLSSMVSLAKPEFTKKERKACIHCHQTAAGGKDLNNAGKYYKEHKSLEGYKK